MGLAVVTGAAGSIGRATVRALVERGLVVATYDRNPLPEAEAEVGLVAREFRLDLRDDAAVGATTAELGSLGTLTHVIAVAGGGDLDELQQADQATMPVEVFERVVANNLTTAFVTVRHLVPLLREADGDRSIVLVGSINWRGGYGSPAYSAAKAGLLGLVNALATPLGADGIRINCLTLGTTDTAYLNDLAEAQGRRLDLAGIAGKAPLKRVLAPDDVASALTAVALDMPGLTGQEIVLDNGQTHIR